MITEGKRNILKVREWDENGAILEDQKQDQDTVFLPKQYMTRAVEAGEELDVFVFIDNIEERIATMVHPAFEVDSFACLTVKAVESYGAFLDGGLPKDIFLPNKLAIYKNFEMGEKRLVYIYTDPLNGKMVASEKLSNFLSEEAVEYEYNQQVDLRIWRKTPLGFRVIINDKSEGMLFKNQVFRHITIGENCKGYIKDIRESDGKIDVSLSKQGFKAHIDEHQKTILDKLSEREGSLPLNDKSAPELIYAELQMSKKNFKKAIGALYKKRQILIEEKGIRLI
jgi:predicted RNA-binding protein (virulence factor B family)